MAPQPEDHAAAGTLGESAMRRTHALVLSLTCAATLIAGGLIGMPTASAAGPAGVDVCVVTARTPYASGGLVFVGGTYSGCASTMSVLMSWSIAGPDQTMHRKDLAASGSTYGWGCNWGSPQNRNLYTTAKMSQGTNDTSSISPFSSSVSDCVL